MFITVGRLWMEMLMKDSVVIAEPRFKHGIQLKHIGRGKLCVSQNNNLLNYCCKPKLFGCEILTTKILNRGVVEKKSSRKHDSTRPFSINLFDIFFILVSNIHETNWIYEGSIFYSLQYVCHELQHYRFLEILIKEKQHFIKKANSHYVLKSYFKYLYCYGLGWSIKQIIQILRFNSYQKRYKVF